MNRNGSLKWLWASLMIIGLVIFGLPMIFLFAYGGFLRNGTGIWGFIALIPLAIVALLVWGLVSLFSKKEEMSNKKAYKPQEHKEPMNLQYLFYIIGIVFMFIMIWYFAREYISQFPNIIKLILLIVSIVASYVFAEFMRESDI